MNKNIIKLAVPAITVAMGIINTGCVATRCYEGYTTAGFETTYVTTPAIETTYIAPPIVEATYVAPPIVETVYEPVYIETVHHNPPPPKPRPKIHPKPQAKPQQAGRYPPAKQPEGAARRGARTPTAPHREAKPQTKPQQAKAAPHQKPAAHNRRK